MAELLLELVLLFVVTPVPVSDEEDEDVAAVSLLLDAAVLVAVSLLEADELPVSLLARATPIRAQSRSLDNILSLPGFTPRLSKFQD